MKEILKRWWQGTYVPPAPNDPHSSVVVISPGTYRLHWSSRAAHVICEFWLAHWQYVISTVIAVVGIFIALKRL